ncbi:unnamed protein product [Boreogadus saida]
MATQKQRACSDMDLTGEFFWNATIPPHGNPTDRMWNSLPVPGGFPSEGPGRMPSPRVTMGTRGQYYGMVVEAGKAGLGGHGRPHPPSCLGGSEPRAPS